MIKNFICWLMTGHKNKTAQRIERHRINAWVEESYVLSECKCGYKSKQLFCTLDYSHGLYKDKGFKL